MWKKYLNRGAQKNTVMLVSTDQNVGFNVTENNVAVNIQTNHTVPVIPLLLKAFMLHHTSTTTDVIPHQV